ncbi:10903_t:CDS:1, partial [Funneliformis caledonium]
PIAAEKFIHIDNETSIGPLSDKEIIDAIISNPEKNDIEEEKESAKINIITNKEDLNSLEK